MGTDSQGHRHQGRQKLLDGGTDRLQEGVVTSQPRILRCSLNAPPGSAGSRWMARLSSLLGDPTAWGAGPVQLPTCCAGRVTGKALFTLSAPGWRISFMSVCPLVWVSSSLRSMIQELPSAPPCPPGAGLHTGVWRGAGHSKALSSVQEVGRAEGKPSSTRMPSSSTAWPGPEGRLQSAGRWLSTRRPQASWLGAGPISQLWVGRLKRNKNNVFQRHCLLSALNSSEKKSLG